MASLSAALLLASCTANAEPRPGACTVTVAPAAANDAPGTARLSAEGLQQRLDLLVLPKFKPCRFTLSAQGTGEGRVLVKVRRGDTNEEVARTSTGNANVSVDEDLIDGMDQAGAIVSKRPTVARLCQHLPLPIGQLSELMRNEDVIYTLSDPEDLHPACDLGCEFLAQGLASSSVYVRANADGWSLTREHLGESEGYEASKRMENAGAVEGVGGPGWYRITKEPNTRKLLAEEVTVPPAGLRTIRATNFILRHGRSIFKRWTLEMRTSSGKVVFQRGGASESRERRGTLEHCGESVMWSSAAGPIGDAIDQRSPF